MLDLFESFHIMQVPKVGFRNGVWSVNFGPRLLALFFYHLWTVCFSCNTETNCRKNLVSVSKWHPRGREPYIWCMIKPPNWELFIGPHFHSPFIHRNLICKWLTLGFWLSQLCDVSYTFNSTEELWGSSSLWTVSHIRLFIHWLVPLSKNKTQKRVLTQHVNQLPTTTIYHSFPSKLQLHQKLPHPWWP